MMPGLMQYLLIVGAIVLVAGAGVAFAAWAMPSDDVDDTEAPGRHRGVPTPRGGDHDDL